MKRILFVDDQPELLEGLRRVLRSQRSTWQMEFVQSGAQALDLIDQQPFDVVVSDMRMPIMDGADLLNEVMRRTPDTVRIMLSGQSDQEQILRAVGPVHQYLSKPCNCDLLKDSINRACALRDLFRGPQLLSLVASVPKLPSIPRVYQQLVELLQSPDVSVKSIGDLISQDLAISCRLLQLVNSCFFGWPSLIESPTHAASLIGLDRLRALTLSAGVFTQFEGNLPREISLDDLMQRSLLTSMAAQRLMLLERPNDATSANEAMLAGIVMDVGHLILLQSRPDDYPRLLDSACCDGKQIWEIESQNYEVTHAELGAYLVGLWGLPDRIVEALAYHHTPRSCTDDEFSVLTAVHVADALVQELDSTSHWPFGAVLDQDYLRTLGLEHRIPVWREQTAALLPGNTT